VLLVGLGLGAPACEVSSSSGGEASEGVRQEISFAQFSEDVRTYQVSEVTIFKPKNPAVDLFRIEGRYRRRQGQQSNLFVSQGRVDENVIAALKAAGVRLYFQE
jgi:hypothetical protein